MLYHPDNLPLPMPGIYQIRNTKDNRVYVGISANVRARAAAHAGCKTTTKKIRAAIQSDPDAFVFEPLFYMSGSNDYEFLMDTEAAIIAENDCVAHGYNARGSSGRGRAAGPEYGATISAALQRPEEKARRSAASKAYKAKPGVRESHAAAMKTWMAENKDAHTAAVRAKSEHISKATKEAMARPDVAAKFAAAMADQEVRARQKAAAVESNKNPDTRKRKSDGMKRVWAARKALLTGKVIVSKEVTT